MKNNTARRRMDAARASGYFVQMEGFRDLDEPIRTAVDDRSPSVPDDAFYEFLARNVRKILFPAVVRGLLLCSLVLVTTCIGTCPAKNIDGRLYHPSLKRAEVTKAFAATSRVGSNPAPSLLLRCTAYSWREPDHRRYGRLNCMGSRLDDGQCAADLALFPLGTILDIPGIGQRTVTDCGSAVCGHHIDLHFTSLAEMNAWGTRILRVTVIRKGWGSCGGQL